jgi:hypothetical protein
MVWMVEYGLAEAARMNDHPSGQSDLGSCPDMLKYAIETDFAVGLSDEIVDYYSFEAACIDLKTDDCCL